MLYLYKNIYYIIYTIYYLLNNINHLYTPLSLPYCLNSTYSRLLHILWHYCSASFLFSAFSLCLPLSRSLGNSCIVRIINALSHCTQIKRLSPGEKRRQLFRLCPVPPRRILHGPMADKFHFR